MLLVEKALDVVYQVACNGGCNSFLLMAGFSGAGLCPTGKAAEVSQTLLRAIRGLLRDERRLRKDIIGCGE